MNYFLSRTEKDMQVSSQSWKSWKLSITNQKETELHSLSGLVHRIFPWEEGCGLFKEPHGHGCHSWSWDTWKKLQKRTESPGWLEGFVGNHSYNTAVVTHETHKPLEFLLSCRHWFLLMSGLFYLNVLFSKSNSTFDEPQWKNNWFGDPVYLIIPIQNLWLLSDSTGKQGDSQLEDDGSAVPFSTMRFISASLTLCFSSDLH